MKHLPNLLTIFRCWLALWAGWLILQARDGSTYLPLLVFVVAAVSDLLDGFLARKLKAESAFGAFLDPVADKLLVGLALLAMCAISGWVWWVWVPTALIVVRDSAITVLRLLWSGGLAVTALAKWKTAAEMSGIVSWLIALALSGAPGFPSDPDALHESYIVVSHSVTFLMGIGLALVWVAALLSVWTGLLYLAAYIRRPKYQNDRA